MSRAGGGNYARDIALRIQSGEDEDLGIRDEDFGDAEHFIAGAEENGQFLIFLEWPLHGLDLRDDGGTDVRRVGCGNGGRLGRCGRSHGIENGILRGLDRLIREGFSDAADRHMFDAITVSP